MSDDEAIRAALEAKLYALGGLPTVWQNKEPAAGFDPAQAHQKAFMLRALNRSLGIKEKTTLHSGIFQVNLCYPAGVGAAMVEARGAAVQAHFAAGTVLESGGVKVRIRGKPSIGNPVTVSPFVVPVSIRYQSFN